MSAYLGIDTSNYTTSAALFDKGKVIQYKMLLPVKEGALGIRQSDAVFHHTQQLPQLMEKLFENNTNRINAIGASVKPRNINGSYMPCFSVGSSSARVLSSALRVPFYSFSHQQGHVAAALYSANQMKLLENRFLAFHVSGGTTEALIVTPDEQDIIHTELVAATLDLNAGQLVDRIGVMLGLPFPCGKALEQLAINYHKPINVKSTLKGVNCCLSGFENKCRKMFEEGASKEKIAGFVLTYIEQTLLDMCTALLQEKGNMPVLFSGGVMSNTIIRKNLTKKLGAYFCAPEFSADNAAGVAVLAAIKDKGINSMPNEERTK